jgi:outer membrane biosynthesis protein TonB
MSTEPSPRAEQIQANVAAALSRLRGEPTAGAPQVMPLPSMHAGGADRILTEGEPLFTVDSNGAPATMGVPDPSMALGGPAGMTDAEARAQRETPFERMTGTKLEDQPDLLQGINASPPPFADLPDAEVEAMRRKRRLRNRLLLGAAAIALLAGFWVLSGGEGGPEEVPVIAADGSPERVKPADEGGLSVPNQDVAILNNADGAAAPQAETVLPAPEQPAAPPPPPEPVAAAPAAEVPATVAASPEAAPAPAAATPAIPSVSAPDVAAIPTVPAPTELGAADPATTTAAAAETPAAAEAAPAEAAPTEPAAAATTTDLPKVSAAIQPVPGGTTRVQLASVKSEDSARQEWARLQKAYPATLGGLELFIERFEKSAGEVYYRVQAGPLGDRASAKQVCADLKQKNQACIVAN